MTSPPRSPPSNLTVVTVEGCPSFVILDWEKPDNDTTGREERRSRSPPWPPAGRPDAAVLSAEYEVISTAKGPDGEQVSVLTTNQTHTAVENLRPESRCVCPALPQLAYPAWVSNQHPAAPETPPSAKSPSRTPPPPPTPLTRVLSWFCPTQNIWKHQERVLHPPLHLRRAEALRPGAQTLTSSCENTPRLRQRRQPEGGGSARRP